MLDAFMKKAGLCLYKLEKVKALKLSLNPNKAGLFEARVVFPGGWGEEGLHISRRTYLISI